jgi:DNA-binding transcriptional LysR family regulator
MEPTLDQLRLFVAIVDAGSFSAAARKLRRAQSAVSYGIGNLEKQLDVRLFERNARAPTLTPAGEALLVAARDVLRRVGELGVRAQGLA